MALHSDFCANQQGSALNIKPRFGKPLPRAGHSEERDDGFLPLLLLCCLIVTGFQTKQTVSTGWRHKELIRPLRMRQFGFSCLRQGDAGRDFSCFRYEFSGPKSNPFT